ncbi:MAG TPA: nucleotidyltransferase family protein [Planctomycetota bacterium]|nr:nucleotidyltransferase family protein [Planctomycetota bacterium]
MTLFEFVRSKRAEILDLAARHGARNIRLFGSIVRGEDNPNSDVDFLVQLEQDRSLMYHAALLVDLEKLLGRPVDVAPEESLRPKLRERILREAVPL